jgi:hypothetical protein
MAATLAPELQVARRFRQFQNGPEHGMMRIMKRRIALFLVSLAVVLLPACSAVYADYCDKRNECLRGNDKDLDACRAITAGEEKAASTYGCVDSFDNFYECRGTGVCANGDFKASCDSQKKAYESCVENASALK